MDNRDQTEELEEVEPQELQVQVVPQDMLDNLDRLVDVDLLALLVQLDSLVRKVHQEDQDLLGARDL